MAGDAVNRLPQKAPSSMVYAASSSSLVASPAAAPREESDTVTPYQLTREARHAVTQRCP